MLPVFADPKTDFVFKRVFGAEAHKRLLVELLNSFLELSEDQRIVEIEYLSLEQRVSVPELKLSIVDVKCTDARGTRYVVEMQVLNIEGFEKRVVYNGSKAYVMQLRDSESYPTLCDVIGVTICDFVLWPREPGRPEVPMLSRWRMQEQHHGALGLSQIQYVFLELPKYAAGDQPVSTVDRWAYFFREAQNLDVIPSPLAEEPYHEALEVARTSHFTAREWEVYDRAKMAEQDQRGALTLAEKQGIARGREEARKDQAAMVQRLLEQRFGKLPEKQLEELAGANAELLSRWSAKILVATSLYDAFEPG